MAECVKTASRRNYATRGGVVFAGYRDYFCVFDADI